MGTYQVQKFGAIPPTDPGDISCECLHTFS